MGSLFRVLFYQPTFNLLIVLYQFFSSNLGWAIVAVAALSRLVTYPLTKSQLKNAEKSKEMQKQYDVVKKKYSKNKEKMNEELMKLQSKYLPSQLGGCLPIIILIILLIQVRSGIVHLVDKGWHAFNEISYSESLKRDEDSVKFTSETDLETGEHKLMISIPTDGGNKLDKEYIFEVVDNKESLETRLEELKEVEQGKSDGDKQNELEERENKIKEERSTDISVFAEEMDENKYSIPISKFLIFVTNSKPIYMFTEKKPVFEFYMRPPSNQVFLSDDIKVFLDDVEVTESSQITQGEALNLNFLGIDLSKVAADFSWSDATIIPYVVLALMVGASQFATSRILTGFRSMGGDKKEEEKKKKEKAKKKKKTDEEEMPDMTDIMNMTSKQMMFMFPALTIITSLGYWGGSNIFPSGLSIFWTVQSLFVIIQQLIMNKDKILLRFNLKQDVKEEKKKKK